MPSPLRLPVGYRVPLRAASGSSPRYQTNHVSDIRETLDQLDRRLVELRRQVASLVEDPQLPEPLAPPPERRLSAVPPQQAPLRTPPESPPAPAPPAPSAPSALLAEAATSRRPHRAKGLDFLFGKAEPAPAPPAVAEPAQPLDDALSPEIAPAATAAADGDPGHVSGQIQELMSVREQLLTGARELVRAYERQLDLLENMAVSGLPGGPEAVATPTSASAGPESVTLPSSAPIAPLPAPIAPSSSPIVPLPGAAVAKAEEDARPAFFEGTVTLLVSGARRIQTIQVLEDSLSRARHVDDVYVRRYHRGRVWIELTLSAGAELLGEFNRVLPFPFAVSSAATKEIGLTLEGEH